MKRKMISFLPLALAVSAVLIFSGCSQKEVSASADEGGLYDLNMMFLTFGTTPADMGLVQDEVNQIAKGVGVKVNFLPVSYGSYQDQTNLVLASGEKIDLIVLLSNQFTSIAAKGQLLDISDLLKEQGKGIVEAVGSDYIIGGQINGKQYAVPTIRDFASNTIFMMNKEIADRNGISEDQIKTLDDIEKVLKIVKDNEPDLAPMVPGSVGTSVAERLFTYDGLGDNIGVLPDYGKGSTVVNFIETDEYRTYLDLMRRWYQAGYILRDAATTQEAGPALIKAGRAFSYFATGKPGLVQQESRLSGVEMIGAEIVPPKTSSTMVQRIQWAVPVNCENPEKTVAFMNLMYTDSKLENLLSWGIEGKHYVIKEGSTIDYPEGIDAKSTGYGLNMGWMFGNQLITYTWAGDDPDLWKKMQTFNSEAIKSSALGFTYDSTNVKNEVAACTNVTNQYKLGLECGLVDPETILPKYIEALEDAGIDLIVAEKQKQLDAWFRK